jgi:hypothetical protein
MTWLSSGREYSGNTAREEMGKARVPEKQGWEVAWVLKKKKFSGLNSSPKYPNEDPTNPAIQRENML